MIGDLPVPATSVPEISIEERIEIDGVLDEPQWEKAAVLTGLRVTDPDTDAVPEYRTVVRLLYSSRGLYVSSEMQQPPETLVERLSARDEGALNRDYFSFTLDTSGEGKYGFWFQLNLGNSRSDGTVQPERNFSDSWDGAWYGFTSRTATGWSAEAFVPWSIVSMPTVEGQRSMAIYVSRKVAHTDERHGFPSLPFTQPRFLSAFHPITFEEVTPRRQLNFFPYVSSTFDAMSDSHEENYGIDLFLRPSSNFQLTATARPDFGTVESDSVVVNLSAIETFYPERRLFFIEGQEIFRATERSGSSWGGGGDTVTLLHTRRIGQRPIFPDIPSGAEFEWSDFSRASDLDLALKATGQTGSMRYGVLGAIEDDSRFFGTLDGDPISVSQTGRDFVVARTLFEDSKSGYKGIGFLTSQLQHESGDVGTYGVDGHYFSESGFFKVDGQVFMSDIPGVETGFGGFLETRISTARGRSHEIELEQFDENVDINHMGYLARNDKRSFEYTYRLRLFPDEWLRESYSRFSTGRSWNGADEVITSFVSLSQQFQFQDGSQVRIRSNYRPETVDDRNSFGNGSYIEGAERSIGLSYNSNSAKRFYFGASQNWSDESTSGMNKFSNLYLTYRPIDAFTASLQLGYSDRNGWLLHRESGFFTTYYAESFAPRFGLRYFLAHNQYLRFDLEWRGYQARQNEFYQLTPESKYLQQVEDPSPKASDDFAISRVNMQLRYRWEIAPLSDLYVVYSKVANHPNSLGLSFADQFTETLDFATSESFIVKIRHRISS